MGKYMRKCRGAAGEEVAAVEVTQVVGVRTRSRSASAAVAPPAGGVAKVSASRRRKPLPPAPESVGDSAAAVGDSGGCYLQLRSRMLFKAPPPQPSPLGLRTEAAGAGQGAALPAGLSRCSSTASSVDASAHERSHACRSHAEEASGDHVPEGSANNSGSGRDRESHLGYLYESEIGIHTYNQMYADKHLFLVHCSRCTIQASLSVCTELLQSADALEMMLKISLSIKQDDQDIAMATKLNRSFREEKEIMQAVQIIMQQALKIKGLQVYEDKGLQF